ncbi:MAG TPA: hypothetical protein VHM70_13220 [Polyangiaceae bacterium]|nr:hypothetical protein [Polyangiaceae bacterium]
MTFTWRTASAIVLGLSLMACLPRDRDLGREKPGTTLDSKAVPKGSDSTATRSPKPAFTGPLASSRPPIVDPPLGESFEDNFERPTLGRDWRTNSLGSWKIEGGRLCARGAHNHPLWLGRQLPTNAKIEFEATSNSEDGDIKVELWGDGRSGATGVSYTNASSYLTIFGGWKNTLHVLARINEHGKDRREVQLSADSADPRARAVVMGQTYRFRIERSDGHKLLWYVDDVEIHEFDDAQPLAGTGHDHFGFNDWEANICFDNLRITALPG